MSTDSDGDGFGALLSAGRRAAGVSQRHLADRVGISVAAIRDLEQGRTRQPQRRFLDAMVSALGLTGDAETALRLAARPRDRAARPDSNQPLRVRILGPLVVHRATASVPVGRGSRRAVLGRLAMSANAPVPVAELVDVLWEAAPPPAPARAVQTYLSKLRSALQPPGSRRAGIVSHVPGGYQLNLADDQLDLAEFRGLVLEARSAEPARGVELLEAALALWHGDPLGDVPQLLDHPLVTALADERIAGTLRYAELALRTGQADRCLPRLRELATANPLHEPLHARLIAVLAAANLQAAALGAYADIRRRLVEDLGIEPGPELMTAHHRVLRQESAVSIGPATGAAPPGSDEPGPPAQLPADIPRFAGRQAALSRLDGILDAHHHGPAVVITAVSGSGGVGKTALAVHWAHRVRARFPDGQLHVNLRGFHPTASPMSPGEALHGFLVALGLPPARVPAGVDAQSALYRTVLADKRVLILLDNARDAEQVRPLLPGAPGCLALITSRHRLISLVAAQDAHALPLDLLTPDEGRQLLARRLGAERIAAEPDAVDAIVGRCARLPLALAVAAARALTHPDAPLSGLAAELRDGRLDALATDDPGTDVRAVFSWSYRKLSAAAARLFRLLGLHPGADLSAPAAASLAGLSPPEALPLLAELTGAALLAEPEPGRYTFHDLMRAYAAERARDEDAEPARHAALARLLDHYLGTAGAAMRVLFPAEQRHPGDAPGPTPAIGGPAAARAWLDTERANLVAIAGAGAANGWPGDTAARTTALAATVHRYLDGGYFSEAIVLHTLAHEAARHGGDRASQARALNNLGAANKRSGRFQQSAGHHERALAICREIGDRAEEARSLSHLGVASWRLGHYPQSERQHRAALDLFRQIGHRLGEANQLNSLGIGTRQAGDHDGALGYHRQALALYQALDHRYGEADALDNLGTSYQQLGRHDEAIECHRRALAIFRELGHRTGEAHARNSLGRALLGRGEPGLARDHHERALALYREIGERSFDVEALNALGAALLATGDTAAARARYRTALALAGQTGDRVEQAAAHHGLGRCCRATGETDQARDHWQRALEIYGGIGLPEAAQVRELLEALDRPR